MTDFRNSPSGSHPCRKRCELLPCKDRVFCRPASLVVADMRVASAGVALRRAVPIGLTVLMAVQHSQTT